MTRVACWLAALGLALAAGGCSVRRRSGDFACQTQADCSTGRLCVDGFCVVSAVDSGVQGDARPAGDAAACPSQCTSCDAGQQSCTIDCALNGGCLQAIVCPTGWSCTVLCSMTDSCRGGIDCLGGTACTIRCSGAQSCQDIRCGLGPCDVDCSGTGSCRAIDCGPSCACDVACGGSSLCRNVTCKQNCSAPLRGCTSAGAGCNTCP